MAAKSWQRRTGSSQLAVRSSRVRSLVLVMGQLADSIQKLLLLRLVQAISSENVGIGSVSTLSPQFNSLDRHFFDLFRLLVDGVSVPGPDGGDPGSVSVKGIVVRPPPPPLLPACEADQTL
jgi:hypothetical protein